MRSRTARSRSSPTSPGRGCSARSRSSPGFIRYGLADLGDRKCVSLSLWETHKEADASVPVVERWVREHIASRVDLRRTQIGDLAFFEGTPARV
jgi:hypothetical protein